MFEIIPNFHPIFVHFTVALFSISTLFYVLSHLTKNPEKQTQWLAVARWNLWSGTAITVFTVAAGWQAFNTVDHDTVSHAAMTVHRNWAIGTAIFYLLITVWSVILYRADKAQSWLFIAVLLVASTALASTAWRGGEVVYRYGLGVMSLPKVEGEGHAHEHADGEGHGDEAAGMKMKSGDTVENENMKSRTNSTADHDDKDGHSHDDENVKPHDDGDGHSLDKDSDSKKPHDDSDGHAH